MKKRSFTYALSHAFLCWPLVVLVALSLVACGADLANHKTASFDEARYAQVARSIKTHYEDHFDELDENSQRHYAQRLYRMTGKVKYVPANRQHAKVLLDELNKALPALPHPGFAEHKAHAKIANYPQHTAKQRSRKQMLAKWGTMIYLEDLVFKLAQTDYYGLLSAHTLPAYPEAKRYLESMDFLAFVTNPEVISVYASQVANLVFFLHQLEIVDLRAEAMAAFQKQYPETRDAELSDAEYQNKIYGMTHFVIAASRYYQTPIDNTRMAWILKQFVRNSDAILARTKQDVYAEVGISLMLAGGAYQASADKFKDALVRAYDPAAQMIPSVHGHTDLGKGEHRNVLAIMLLAWPPQLHKGPKLQTDDLGLRTIKINSAHKVSKQAMMAKPIPVAWMPNH